MDCSLPGSSVYGILQAKNTGVVAIKHLKSRYEQSPVECQSHPSYIAFSCSHLTPNIGIEIHNLEQKPIKLRDFLLSTYKFWLKVLPFPNLSGKISMLACRTPRKIN